MRGGTDDKVHVPSFHLEREQRDLLAGGERLTDHRADCVQTMFGKLIDRMFESPQVGGFEFGIGRQDDAVVDPTSAVTTEPRAVGGHGEHDGPRVIHKISPA